MQHADYLLVIAVALVLNSANVVGYTKCSKQASGQLRDMARNAMTSGLTVRRATVVLHVLCLSMAVHNILLVQPMISGRFVLQAAISRV